ncbi:hypothetical protein Acsp05_30310 [Actinokineospora sp. NBRC 105648]|nr:hypothetical protein Acsp05_30310 [Actinokineospora sp. NBRC 105648]
MRWLLAAVLVAAAAVNGYLAISEWVLWPAPLALIWIGVAAALVIPPADPYDGPRTAREALALTEPSRGHHRPARSDLLVS